MTGGVQGLLPSPGASFEGERPKKREPQGVQPSGLKDRRSEITPVSLKHPEYNADSIYRHVFLGRLQHVRQKECHIPILPLTRSTVLAQFLP